MPTYKKHINTMKQLPELRLKAFLRYGGIYCTCCSSSTHEVLSLVPVQNLDPTKRKLLMSKAYNFKWLDTNNYPTGLEVLCMNCKIGSQYNKRTCPHKTSEAST